MGVKCLFGDVAGNYRLAFVFRWLSQVRKFSTACDWEDGAVTTVGTGAAHKAAVGGAKVNFQVVIQDPPYMIKNSLSFLDLLFSP